MWVGGMDDMDAGLYLSAFAPAAAGLAEIGAPFRVEQVEGGLTGLPVSTLAVSFAVALVLALECAFPGTVKSLWHRAFGPRLHLHVARHDDDQSPDRRFR